MIFVKENRMFTE